MKRKPLKPARKPLAAKGKARPKASLRDVLGALPEQAEVPPKWKKFYNRLIALQARIQRNKDLLTQDALEEQPAFSLHMADAGTDTFDRDLALSLISSEQNALYEIQQALDRIRNGSYGRCEMTGKRIERERLEALPWTRFSTEAERALESSGQDQRARLGPRQRLPRTVVPEPAEEEEG